MVSPIDASQTLARLAALMREAMGRHRAAGAPPRRQQDGTPPGVSERRVAQALAQRLRAIGTGHPQRRLALSRILVESLLTQEFGEAVLNDAAFQVVVDDVLDAMRRSATVSADLDRVVDSLLADTPSE